MRKLEFLDKSGREVGYVHISTQYVWAEGASTAHVTASPRQSYLHGTSSYVTDSHPHHYSPARVIHSGDHLTEYIRPHLQ
jgi:hypothetical protein